MYAHKKNTHKEAFKYAGALCVCVGLLVGLCTMEQRGENQYTLQRVADC